MQFSNEFDVLSRKNNPGSGEGYSVSWAMEHSSQGIVGKIEFYRMLGEARWKQGLIGQVRDFLTRLEGPTV